MKETKKIKDNQLENVSGGRLVRDDAPVHETTFWEKFKNFFGFGKKEETQGKQEVIPGSDPNSLPPEHADHPIVGAWETRTCPKCGEVYKCNPSLPPQFSNMHHCSKENSGE